MIEDNALVLIIGIAIGFLLCFMAFLQFYVWRDLAKKYKELFQEIRDLFAKQGEEE